MGVGQQKKPMLMHRLICMTGGADPQVQWLAPDRPPLTRAGLPP